MTKASKEAELRQAFVKTCNIPYGGVGGRDTMQMLANNRGSCSTKHAYLGLLASQLGYPVRYMLGRTDLRQLNVFLPSRLHFHEEIIDFHNYLEIRIRDEYVRVDATFGRREREKGLPSNERWDGQKDCIIIFPVQSAEAVSDIFSAKRAALETLSETQLTRRQDAFTRLVHYLEE